MLGYFDFGYWNTFVASFFPVVMDGMRIVARCPDDILNEISLGI